MPRTHTPLTTRKGRPTVAEREVLAAFQAAERIPAAMLHGVKVRKRGGQPKPGRKRLTPSQVVMARHAALKADGWVLKGAWLPPHALAALAALARAQDIAEAEVIRRLILAAADAAAIED